MMNQDLKFHFLAIFEFLEMMNGLDSTNGPHRNKMFQYLGFGIFRKYLRIHDETTAEI